MKKTVLTVLFVSIICFTTACSSRGTNEGKQPQEAESETSPEQTDIQIEIDDTQTEADEERAKEIQEEKDKKVQEMVSSIEIQLEEETPVWCSYSGIMENTSGMDFQSMNIRFSLLDDDGVIVDEPFMLLDSVKDGDKIKVKFTTTEYFSDYKVSAEWIEKQSLTDDSDTQIDADSKENDKTAIKAKELEEKDKKVQEMVSTIEIQLEEDTPVWCSYSGVMENTSGMDFQSMIIYFSLLDDDGVIVDEPFMLLDSVKDGDKIKVEFTTTEYFSNYKVRAEWIEEE